MTPLSGSKQHLLGELAGLLWTLWDQVWAVEGPCGAMGLCTRVGTRAQTSYGGSCWARRGWEVSGLFVNHISWCVSAVSDRQCPC